MAWIDDDDLPPGEILDDGIRARKAGEPRRVRKSGQEAVDVSIWSFGWDLVDGYELALGRFDAAMCN